MTSSICHNLGGSTWRRRQNPVSETSRTHIKDRTINNVQNCDSYINIPSSEACSVIYGLSEHLEAGYKKTNI
jgi:hypothetical protein